MKSNKYLIRLDDACPTMHAKNWDKIELILDQYHIKPMVGVIPSNQDPAQLHSTYDNNFWGKVTKWEKKGWSIALHGYDHVYISSATGINPIWSKSEFAGVPLEIQEQKIAQGVNIFRKNGINPKFFFAPSHTFDLNTLKALEKSSDIKIISDTIATKPYKSHGFIFVPQLGGHCQEMKLKGIWTFCLHPSVMDNKSFEDLSIFLKSHNTEFISFNDIDYQKVARKSIISKIISFVYFTRRKFLKIHR